MVILTVCFGTEAQLEGRCGRVRISHIFSLGGLGCWLVGMEVFVRRQYVLEAKLQS